MTPAAASPAAASPAAAFVAPLAVPRAVPSPLYARTFLVHVRPHPRRRPVHPPHPACALDPAPNAAPQPLPPPAFRPKALAISLAAAVLPLLPLLPSAALAAPARLRTSNAPTATITSASVAVATTNPANQSPTNATVRPRTHNTNTLQHHPEHQLRSHPRRAASLAFALRSVLPARSDPFPHAALKSLLLLGVAIGVVTAVTISVFWVIQDSLVYKPTTVWRGNPAASGMPHYDDVSFTTPDGPILTGWFIRQPDSSYTTSRTLIYFHGTDKNASFRLRKVIGFYERCRCNVLLLSYRGYGRSTGKPNERGFRIDADCAYKYLAARGDVNVGPGGNLWVYGESLGGAVAVHFSARYEECVRALILENTFTSLLDMIKLEFPMLGVFRYLSRNRWQSKKHIGSLTIPLLFLSGLKDAYIPPRMMREMHSRATGSKMKEFVEFEKGTHNGTWMMDGFYETVARFMDRVEGRAESLTGADDHSSGAEASSGSSGSSASASAPSPSSRGIDEGGRFAAA